jgi:hypothetical protein
MKIDKKVEPKLWDQSQGLPKRDNEAIDRTNSTIFNCNSVQSKILETICHIHQTTH